MVKLQFSNFLWSSKGPIKLAGLSSSLGPIPFIIGRPNEKDRTARPGAKPPPLRIFWIVLKTRLVFRISQALFVLSPSINPLYGPFPVRYYPFVSPQFLRSSSLFHLEKHPRIPLLVDGVLSRTNLQIAQSCLLGE